MSKQYRLLKDLPDAAIGTILTHDGFETYCYDTNLRVPEMNAWYYEQFVENNPEWFAEIKSSEPESEPTYTLSEVLAALPDEASKEGIAANLRAKKK